MDTTKTQVIEGYSLSERVLNLVACLGRHVGSPDTLMSGVSGVCVVALAIVAMATCVFQEATGFMPTGFLPSGEPMPELSLSWAVAMVGLYARTTARPEMLEKGVDSGLLLLSGGLLMVAVFFRIIAATAPAMFQWSVALLT